VQNDFLRLHEEIRKTVIFVTHDIDEAIKMGHRICILREGGTLAQYDTPEAILANPADDFVARFVGADRGLKRLSLRRVRDVDLLRGDAAPGCPECSPDTTLRDALSSMLTAGSTAVSVRRPGGELEGHLTFEAVSGLLGSQDEVAA
jgi:osmoprotectant transport system ATP-binding protein